MAYRHLCISSFHGFHEDPAKIDRRFETCGQNEIGFRYFKGAPAGTVMIGEHPETEVFTEHFGWPDSVIHVPFDSPDITDILAELDSEPERIEPQPERTILSNQLYAMTGPIDGVLF